MHSMQQSTEIREPFFTNCTARRRQAGARQGWPNMEKSSGPKHAPMAAAEYGMMLAVLIALTVADTVLCTVNLHCEPDTSACTGIPPAAAL